MNKVSNQHKKVVVKKKKIIKVENRVMNKFEEKNPFLLKTL